MHLIKSRKLSLKLQPFPVLIISNHSVSFPLPLKQPLLLFLLKKNEDSHDQTIAFFSKVMRDDELKYVIIEKKAYALIQVLKSFRMYVLHSPITTYVPSSVVNFFLAQLDTNGKRGRWITQILEFDLIIKTTKLVKGQQLANLLVESNCRVLGINFSWEIEGENPPEPTQSSNNKNPQEPSVYIEGESQREPSQHLEEKNPQEP